jgi:signal transduction histidine kinase
MEKVLHNLKVKILLVDDKPENLLSLQIVLANQGYEFVEASSGKEALRILLKEQDFAIILLDVQMPQMDGFETAELIRQSDKLKHVPIIFLTANMNAPDSIFKGYQSGAVDYMIKPLSPDILQAKVKVFTELYRKNHELEIKEEETKRLNLALVEANDELKNQYEEVKRHAYELQRKNKELDAFTYVSSHDLQEPLRKIETFSKMILSKELDNLSDDGKKKFERIIYSADRMRQLINSLLAFSHTDTAEKLFEDVDLTTIINEVREMLNELIAEKHVIIETELHGASPIIPFQFIQLMQNLITNSIKFAKPNVAPHIIIKSRIVNGKQTEEESLSHDRNYCHIIFQDNGIGFEQQFNDKIFEVFQKLHNRETYEGTGIGLAIVKKIIDNHNGLIKATGTLMEGARFDIYIPN